MRLRPVSCVLVLLSSLLSPIHAASAQSRPETVAAPLVLAPLMGDTKDLDVAAIRRAADAGDARAQRTMGDVHRLGIGVPIDPRQSLAWFRRAAAAGDDYSAGHVYQVESRHTEARAAYRRAAERGDAAAQAALGASYFGVSGGTPPPPDYAQSLAWHTRAADQGYFEGLFGLGGLYATGLGVRRDMVEAHKLLSLALSFVGQMQFKQYMQDAVNSVSATMTEAQITEARKRAEEWRARFKAGSAK